MAYIITEILPIDVIDACSGVYLRWINDLGGIDQWLFTGNETQLIEKSDVVYFEPYIDELADQTENFKALSFDYNETLKIYTTFDKANAEGFKQLVRSRSIQMLLNDEWYSVGVALDNFNVQKTNPYGKITLQIVTPKKYLY